MSAKAIVAVMSARTHALADARALVSLARKLCDQAPDPVTLDARRHDLAEAARELLRLEREKPGG